MNGVEINTRACVATRLLLRWDYLYAVTLKTKVFGDYSGFHFFYAKLCLIL